MIVVLLFLIFNFSSRENELILWLNPSTRPQLSKLNPEYYGDILTVKTKSLGIPEIDSLNEFFGVEKIERLLLGKLDEKIKEYKLDLLYILKFNEPVDVAKAISSYKKLKSVDDAFPDLKYKVFAEPNDPYFGPDFYNEQWYLFKIQAPQAWDITTGDSSIIVGPVDTGVDWEHPDIFPNLWVNPGEDLNQNGVFDYPDDINGIDDDGNGFVDDIIGFDFLDNDWNPYPHEAGNEHGTHVFGIVTAATNNGIGVAGVGWNIKGMALKCGDGQYMYLSAILNAMNYAIDNGVASTNHSYGSLSFNPALNSIIQLAHEMRITIIASVGSDNTSISVYPACYENVIGVAATGFDDTKAPFSNYGIGVDVCAPGINIWSTVPNGGYSAFSGTSMASPIVCGIASLIRSLHPDWDAFAIDSSIMWGAQNIDSINPAHAGQLGWGRVNTWRTSALSLFPYIEIVDFYFDGDGRPEPGEIVKLYLKVTNLEHWQNAQNVTFTLSTDDPCIAIIDSLAAVPFIGSGDSLNLSDYFELEIGGDVRFSKLHVAISSEPQTIKEVDTLSILIGYPELVIVNDAEEGESVDKWYRETLDELGLVYEEWNADEGLPESFLSHNRTVVIWFTGNDSTEVMSQEEIDSLVSYLSAEGNLFITSQYLAEDPDAQSFIHNYLGAEITEYNVPYRVMRGYANDPVGDSLIINLYGPGGAGNCLSPDKVRSINGADTVLFFTNLSGNGNFGPGAVRYENGFKTLYFPFPFEAIDDSAEFRNKKSEVLYRILDWFGYTNLKEKAKPPLLSKPLLIPTIVRDKAEIKFTSHPEGKVRIELYDLSGRKLLSFSRMIERNGNCFIPIDLKSLPQGIYIIRLERETELKSFKLVKVR